MTLGTTELLGIVVTLWVAAIAAWFYIQSQITAIQTRAQDKTEDTRRELIGAIGDSERRITERLISLEKLIEARQLAQQAVTAKA